MGSFLKKLIYFLTALDGLWDQELNLGAAGKALSPNHWTAREVLSFFFIEVVLIHNVVLVSGIFNVEMTVFLYISQSGFWIFCSYIPEAVWPQGREYGS